MSATLYLAMHTRPNVAYAVGVLSRRCKQPSLAACKLMVYLLRYIRGSTDKGIRFSESSLYLHVFSDADWAGDRKVVVDVNALLDYFFLAWMVASFFEGVYQCALQLG